MSGVGQIASKPIGGRVRGSAKRSASTLTRTAAIFTISIGVGVASGETLNPVMGVVNFHIPPAPLVDALQTYSQQSGVQVMFETVSAAGFRSSPVDGAYMPQVALRLLLADTDLKVRYSRSSAVTLAPASAPDPDAPPAGPLASVDMWLDTLHLKSGNDTDDQSRLGEYIGAVEADIRKAIQRASHDRRVDYRFTVKLSVSPTSRTIEKAELDGSTGDRDRDSTISEALRSMTVSQQAPANSPRTLRFMVSIRQL